MDVCQRTSFFTQYLIIHDLLQSKHSHKYIIVKVSNTFSFFLVFQLYIYYIYLLIISGNYPRIH